MHWKNAYITWGLQNLTVSYEAEVSFFSFLTWVCLILPVPQTILDNYLNSLLLCCIILHAQAIFLVVETVVKGPNIEELETHFNIRLS